MNDAARRTASPDALGQALADAKQRRPKLAASRSTASIVEALATASTKWLDPDYPPRLELTAQLSARLSMDPAMLAQGFDHLFSSMGREALEQLITSEAAPAEALERAVERRGRPMRLAGPPVVFLYPAGNVPGLALPAITACLLARSVCVVRDSSRTRGLTTAYLSTLAGLDPELASMVVEAEWSAGDEAMEALALAEAGRAEVSGTRHTLLELAGRHGSAVFIEQGPRLSLGYVPAGSDTDAAARGFAEDAAMFEGLGCLTPHLVMVEGAPERARRTAKVLSLAFSRLQLRWPRRRGRLEGESARRIFIDSAQVSALANDDELLARGRGDQWCVHLDPRARMRPGPGGRTVKVIPAGERAGALAMLAEAEEPLAAVGLAMEENERGFGELKRAFSHLGASLICAPGLMQRPPLAWQQNGRRRLGDLLCWQVEEKP